MLRFLRPVLFVCGILVLIMAGLMLSVAVFAWWRQDPEMQVFLTSFAVTLGCGLAMVLGCRDKGFHLVSRQLYLLTSLSWVLLSLFGALPLFFSHFQLSAEDAVFEAVSGITTTGSTILSGIEHLAPSLLLWRSLLQWIGGLGVIGMAVSILPFLRVGGMRLFHTESSDWSDKSIPRVQSLARMLVATYLGLTVSCVFSYWLAGMNLFDAICHAFSTVAIGGFSTYDGSIGHFNSPVIDMIAVVFMFLAGVNFSLHFLAWRDTSLKGYLLDSEFRAYLKFLCCLTAVVLLYLYWVGYYGTLFDTFTKGLFQVVSISTTTGFTTTDFAAWPGALPIILILSSFVGGCAGSTAGGMKVIRWLLMYKQGLREVQRLVHPSAEIPVKLGSRRVHHRVVDAVWGFFAVYVVVFGVLLIIQLASGLEVVSAFAAVAVTLNNLGPGLGEVASGFGDVSAVGKWSAVCGMLLGRLEIFTLLVLITPTFWRP